MKIDGPALRRIRLGAGITQKKWGKMFNVATSTVIRWENGTNIPRRVMREKIQSVLEEIKKKKEGILDHSNEHVVDMRFESTAELTIPEYHSAGFPKGKSPKGSGVVVTVPVICRWGENGTRGRRQVWVRADDIVGLNGEPRNVRGWLSLEPDNYAANANQPKEDVEIENAKPLGGNEFSCSGVSVIGDEW